MTKIINALADVSDRYDAVLCDLWGCLHNGRNAFPEAVAALQAFRATGGAVILLTNAPRPHSAVAKQLDALGVPHDAWDAIVSSGDSAQAAMFRGIVGNKVHFIGYPRDLTFFDPPETVHDSVEITRVPLDQAEGLVVTGPEDPYADPSVYRPQFLYAKQKGMKLLCANPDLIVDYGEERQYCAGSLAALYTEMGGESLYFGKPHPAIYDLARRRLESLGKAPTEGRILAIGDGIRTDVAGATGEDMDVLFVTGGLAAEETGTTRQPDATALDAFLASERYDPLYSIGFLR